MSPRQNEIRSIFRSRGICSLDEIDQILIGNPYFEGLSSDDKRPMIRRLIFKLKMRNYIRRIGRSQYEFINMNYNNVERL